MEKIAEFNDDNGFNVKLTKDKVFVSSIGNEETFALRSVNGVGLYDDIKKYNLDLESYKNMNDNSLYIGYAAVVSVTAAVIAIISFSKNNVGNALGSLLISGISSLLTYYFVKKKQGGPRPKLDSYFKLMLSGGSREFQFDKSEENSVKIADFINKLEDTLTSYK
jgi:hypothetical protein